MATKKHFSVDLRDGLRVVRASRSIAQPNVGFLKQLGYFEEHLLDKVTGKVDLRRVFKD